MGEGTIPSGATLAGGIHSHAAYDPNYDSENFSRGDKNFANRRGVPEYIVTPGGNLKRYDPSTNSETVIASDLPKDPNSP